MTRIQSDPAAQSLKTEVSLPYKILFPFLFLWRFFLSFRKFSAALTEIIIARPPFRIVSKKRESLNCSMIRWLQPAFRRVMPRLYAQESIKSFLRIKRDLVEHFFRFCACSAQILLHL